MLPAESASVMTILPLYLGASRSHQDWISPGLIKFVLIAAIPDPASP